MQSDRSTNSQLSGQYRRRYSRKKDSPKAFRCVLLVMSGTRLGNLLFTWYSKRCSNISYGCYQRPCHSWYLVAGQSIQGISSWKHSLGDNINPNTNRLIRYINKVFPNLSLEANEVEISTGRKVMIFRHEYQTKEKVGNYLFILQERRTHQRFLSL